MAMGCVTRENVSVIHLGLERCVASSTVPQLTALTMETVLRVSILLWKFETPNHA